MRKIQKPSEEFLKFLELVNHLHNVNLPPRASLNPANAKQIIFETIRKYPELHEFVFNKKVDEPVSLTERRVGIWEKYESFREDRELLLRITDELTGKPDYNKDEIVIENLFVHTLITLDQNGKLKFERASFRRFEDLDVTRFRVCPVCSDIFWASRTDKKACSKCSNIAAQRAYQQKNREEINIQRRETYAYKKTMKKNKEKKNGTL